MPILRRYRIFISHAWNHGEDYWRIVQFLNESPHFRWENLSVPEHEVVGWGEHRSCDPTACTSDGAMMVAGQRG
jgi:hypothetical protein